MSRTFSGQKLRDARTAAGIPIERMALDVGRSVFTVVDYERGRTRPSPDVVGSLADVLGCSVDDFYNTPETVA